MVYRYTRIFSLKRCPALCNNMDEPWRHYAERNKPVTSRTNTSWLHLHEVSKIVKLKRSGEYNGGARDEGEGEIGFNGQKGSLMQDT